MMGEVVDLKLFALPAPVVGPTSSVAVRTASMTRPMAIPADQHIKDVEFLSGPIRMGWIEAAAKLSGAALQVALLVRHLHVMRGRDWVVLSNVAAQKFGVSSSAKARAVAALEDAGLIVVQRQRGCAPRVKPIGDRCSECLDVG